MGKKLLAQRFTCDLAGGIAGNIQVIERWELQDDKNPDDVAEMPQRTREATPEELTAILGPELAKSIADNAALNAVNDDLQKQMEDLKAKTNDEQQKLMDEVHKARDERDTAVVLANGFRAKFENIIKIINQ